MPPHILISNVKTYPTKQRGSSRVANGKDVVLPHLPREEVKRNLPR